MNIVKMPAALVLSAMLFACGSQDVPNEPPPDYSKYPNIDKEPNNTQDSAVDIEANGIITMGKAIEFTGSLDNKFNIGEDGDLVGVTMDVDYYKLELKTDDTISISVLNSTSPFRFRFYGPCPRKKECADTTIIVSNKTASLKYPIKTGHVVGDIRDKATHYIKVFSSLEDFKNDHNEENKYIISVKLLNYRE
jgi:hypothetical protein